MVGDTLSSAGETTPSPADEFLAQLQRDQKRGLVLDIDETLSWTNYYWIQQLQKLFGNPENLQPEEIAAKYHLCQKVPYWAEQKEALQWMAKMRTSCEAQEHLPLIKGALEGVRNLQETCEVVGYLTVRPECVSASTKKWLRQHQFPDLPVISKPDDVPFSEGNKWKAAVLNRCHPHIQGIVDDNPSVARFCGQDYPGVVFLFSQSSFEYSSWGQVVPCVDWAEVVRQAQAWKDGKTS